MGTEIPLSFADFSWGHYIAVQGKHLVFYAKCQIPQYIRYLNMVWLLKEQSKPQFSYSLWQQCLVYGNRKLSCLTVNTHTKRKYTIVGDTDLYYGHEGVTLSANQVTIICKHRGKILPQFFSSDALDEFISLLLASDKMPVIEGIFIGLEYNMKEVSQIVGGI